MKMRDEIYKCLRRTILNGVVIDPGEMVKATSCPGEAFVLIEVTNEPELYAKTRRTEPPPLDDYDPWKMLG